MRTASISSLPNGQARVDLSDPPEFATFASPSEAEAFLLRAGWQLLAVGMRPQIYREPEFVPRPFVAVPGPAGLGVMSRAPVNILPKMIELWHFRISRDVLGLREVLGFRFGLAHLPFFLEVEDPVLSLLAPYPLRIEAIGYWEHVPDVLNAATMLVEQLENLYGRELFHASLDQNVQRILSSQPR